MNRTVVLSAVIWMALSQNACMDGLTKPATEAVPEKPEAAQAALPVKAKSSGPRPELTADVVYDVLAGEIAGQRGDLQRSVAYLLRASETAGDVGLTKRAARVALLSHDYASAVQAVDRWLLLEPDNKEAMRTASVLYMRTGDVERSAQQLNDIVSRAGTDTSGVFESVVVQLIRESNKQAALGVAEALAKSHPEDRFALYALGRVAFYAEDYSRSAAALERALAIEPDWPKAQSFLARVYVKAGEVEKGVVALRALLEETPDNNELRQGYARLLLEARDYPEAREQFIRILDADDKDTDALYALGLLELDAERTDAAEKYFEQLIELKTRTNEAAFYLGNIAEKREDWAGAAGWYARVTSGSFAADARIRQAQMIAKRGHIDAAVAQLRALGERDQRLAPRLFIIEAEIYKDAGQLNKALKSYDAALEQIPDHVDLLYARGLLAEQLGRIDWLERDLRRVIDLEPDNAHALNALGYTLADRTDRYPEALDLVQRAFKLLPEDHAIIDSMGWVNYRLGNLGEAVKHLRKAMQLRPDAEIAAHLGEVLWVMGDQSGARQVWAKGRELQPDSPILAETVKRLEK